MNHDLYLQVLGRDPLTDPAALAAVFDTIERHVPAWRPERWGVDEPFDRPWGGPEPFVEDDFYAEGDRVWIATHPARPPVLHSSVFLHGFAADTDQDTALELLATLSRLVDADFGFVQQLRADSAVVTQPDAYAGLDHPAHMLPLHLPTIYWATVLGPAFDALFGPDRIASSPAERVERLDERRWLLQLTPGMGDVNDDLERRRAASRAVREHLGKEAFEAPSFRDPDRGRRADFSDLRAERAGQS